MTTLTLEEKQSPDRTEASLPVETRLPTGRTLTIRLGAEGEEILVRSPEGSTEVAIHLTDAGPVVKLAPASLELSTVENLSVSCGRFDVQAGEAVLSAKEMSLETDGVLRLRSASDMRLDGERLLLNCKKI